MDVDLDDTNNSDNISDNISTTSSLRRSRMAPSLRHSSIALNDDESERAAIRRQSISSVNNNPRNNRRSLFIPEDIAQMMPEQVQAGIAECIEMNIKNKINLKNAFAVNIIDFMAYMVRKNDISVEKTLQVGTNALDISAKVYSYRVDALHQNVLTLADKFGKPTGNTNQNDVEANNNGENHDRREVNKVNEKRKKRKKNSSQLTKIESLQGDCDRVTLAPTMSLVDSDFQTTDMLLLAKIPKHCHQTGLELYFDIFIDQPDDNSIDQNNPSRITWPLVPIYCHEVIHSSLGDFSFLNWSPDDETDDMTSTTSCQHDLPSVSHDDDAHVFDLNASVHDDSNEFGPVFYDSEMADEFEIRNSNARLHREVENIVNIADVNGLNGALARDRMAPLDYSFFSYPVRINYVGPGYWKIKWVPIENGDDGEEADAGLALQRRGRARRRELNLEFNREKIDIATQMLEGKVKGKVRVVGWSSRNTNLSVKVQHNIDILKRFFLKPENSVEFAVDRQLDNATNVSDDYDNDNDNDVDVDVDVNVENIEPVNGNSVNAEMNNTNNSFDINISTQRTEASSEFIGDNMVEIPKLTQVYQITHSQRAKKINIRKLKKFIWIKLKTMRDNIRNSINGLNFNINNNVIDVDYKIKLTQLYTELPELLPKKYLADLSFPIAFTIILQLANEKNFVLLPTDNLDDTLISLPNEIN